MYEGGYGQLVTQLDQQIAALVALVAVSLVGIEFAVIKKAWQLFERRCLALPREERGHIARNTLLILLYIIIIEGIFIYSRLYVPAEYNDWAALFLLIIFSLLVLLISFIVWIIRKIRKRSAYKPDTAGLLSSLSIGILIMSILCNIFALISVSATMLNVEAGPYGPQNYAFGKWILTAAISLFFIWMFLHASTFIQDYFKKRAGRGREF
jgi:uncharacterized membrane protein